MKTVLGGAGDVSSVKSDFLADPAECEFDLDLMGALASRDELQSIANKLPDDSETKAYLLDFMSQRGGFPSQQSQILQAA